MKKRFGLYATYWAILLALFNVIAFVGMYDGGTLVSIIVSSYVIYIFTSLMDTPFVYLARSMKERGKIAN
jgi:uncharacterized PurR-regulated membrane protein YhhQ (DUF165 family)